MTMYHIPVMVEEVINFLNLHPGMTVVDATIGTGGHAEKILEKIMPSGRLIGIDRDEESLEVVKKRLYDYQSHIDLVHNDFRNIEKILDNLNIDRVDAVLFDLGISSHQLENPERGFSIKSEGPLDMRMDRNSYISAYDLVNNLTKDELSLIIKDFGQERWHNRIAESLTLIRRNSPISTTAQLSQAVLNAIPYKRDYWRIHPATRTFQALRIAVNRELEAIQEGLISAVGAVKNNGRVVAISFHSLEDRIVKNIFRDYARRQKLHILTKKPLRPSAQEITQNPRARSACLRAVEIRGEL